MQYHGLISSITCTEVLHALATHQVHYAILEMFPADGNIFSSTYKLIGHARVTRILVYTRNEKLYAHRLMQKGIRGSISRHASVEELII